jgi:hypothetical protein
MESMAQKRRTIIVSLDSLVHILGAWRLCFASMSFPRRCGGGGCEDDDVRPSSQRSRTVDAKPRTREVKKDRRMKSDPSPSFKYRVP